MKLHKTDLFGPLVTEFELSEHFRSEKDTMTSSVKIFKNLIFRCIFTAKYWPAKNENYRHSSLGSLGILTNHHSRTLHMVRLNSEDFSKFFLCLDIIFLTYTFERTHLIVPKNVEIFRIFLNIHDFFEVFRSKVFCTVSYSHVLGTIRFTIKFHVRLLLSGRWETLREIGFTPKTVQKWDLTRVGIA